jgi:predicted AlkP superfamily pyrophosphatase or phosphodiesterase
VLAVSFSTHDYAAHGYGPESREMEEMTVADDAVIARILNSVKSKVPGGLDAVTIVLTGDHGSNWNPDSLKANRIDAQRINIKDQQARIEAMLEKRHGKLSEKLGRWVPLASDFAYYLNPAAMADKGLDPSAVEDEVKALLRDEPGTAHVFSGTDVRLRRLPPGMHERQILKTYFPGRSADVIVIPKPFYVAEGSTVDHMTGYAYDRTVPIVLTGFGIKPGVHAEKAEVIDIAPTLTFLAGAMPPALTEGRVLSESLSIR